MTQVFISYSRKDLVFVERLAKDLQSAGLQVWYDLSGLDGGARWGREIQSAIQQSQIFVVVLSPNSIDSQWVEREFMYADSLKKKIIPLLYQPCKTPMWFINLHFIDVQGDNYDSHFWVILKAMGVKAGDATPQGKPAPMVSEHQASLELPQPLLQEKEPERKNTLRASKFHPAWIIVLVGLVAVIAFAVWGMPALSARLAPTLTFTPTATLTPTVMVKPTSISTPTLTLVPSPTLTASPTIDPTTGVVSGSVMWNNQPFGSVVVKLCTKWLYTCNGVQFGGVSADDGKFTIAGITPGDYQVITKYPGQNDETRMQDSSGTGQAGLPKVVTVIAGKSTYMGNVTLCKVDLVLFAPTIKGHSVTFSWKAYPGATSYNYSVDGTNVGGWFLPSTSFTGTLPSGSYQWRIQTNGPCSQGIGNFSVP
jgi:hypothetical protein